MTNSNLLSKIDSLLITNPTNIRYLTGFVGAAPDEREAYVLVTKNKTFLFTNALYLEQAKTTNTTLVEISRENPFAKKLGEALKRSHPAKQGETLKVGFEESDLTVAEYQKIKRELPGVHFVPTENRIEKLRMIKRDDEIANIRQAAKITDDCFAYLTTRLKPSVTESEIAWEIESFFRKRGAEAAFSPIVAFGKNTSQPHYNANFTRPRLETEAPQGEALKKQDIILLDFGARVNGYCSDMTRVVFVGEPKVEWRSAYEVVRRANHLATSELDDTFTSLHAMGEPVCEFGAALDRWIRDEIKKAGFVPYPHNLGHGVGLAIHEQPRISYKRRSTMLRAGMVVTVEPAIYIEGSYGIRIEDLVLLTKDGIDILSKSSKKFIIL